MHSTSSYKTAQSLFSPLNNVCVCRTGLCTGNKHTHTLHLLQLTPPWLHKRSAGYITLLAHVLEPIEIFTRNPFFALEEPCQSPLPWLYSLHCSSVYTLSISLFLLISAGKFSDHLSITALWLNWIAWVPVRALHNETKSPKTKWNIFQRCDKPRKQERESLHTDAYTGLSLSLLLPWAVSIC